MGPHGLTRFQLPSIWRMLGQCAVSGSLEQGFLHILGSANQFYPLWKHSWPLNNAGLNYTDLHISRFFLVALCCSRVKRKLRSLAGRGLTDSRLHPGLPVHGQSRPLTLRGSKVSCVRKKAPLLLLGLPISPPHQRRDLMVARFGEKPLPRRGLAPAAAVFRTHYSPPQGRASPVDGGPVLGDHTGKFNWE